jgi:hypothetical protein
MLTPVHKPWSEKRSQRKAQVEKKKPSSPPRKAK